MSFDSAFRIFRIASFGMAVCAGVCTGVACATTTSNTNPEQNTAAQNTTAQNTAAQEHAHHGTADTTNKTDKTDKTDKTESIDENDITVRFASGTHFVGTVVETVAVAEYVYMRMQVNDAFYPEVWVAVQKTPISVGARVQIEVSLTTKGFYSKSLDRTFDALIMGLIAAPISDVH